MAELRKIIGPRDSVLLLEREQELEILRTALAQARDDAGSLLVVEGPAGIGKTSVLQATAELARDSRYLVRTSRGYEMERDLPFGVVRQLFDHLVERATEEERQAWLSGAAHQALTAIGSADQDRDPSRSRDPFATINGLYWLVANLSASDPVVLIIDDAQWSDAASLRFVGFLARRLSELNVALILGVRTGEPNEPPEVQALRVEANVLDLQPLTAPSVHELILTRTGEVPSEEFSKACAAASAGNPLLVIEILRELMTDGQNLNRDAAQAVATIAPDSVARKVLFRLRRFGEEAVALANAISVLGRSPQLRHAALLSGLGEDVARTVCDDLRRAEILAQGLPIDFVHPVVRQAIYRGQPEEQRSVAHRRAAEILHSTGARAQEVASHLLACAPNGDQWVVERLETAARISIAEGAYDGAVTYLDRSLEEPPEDSLALLYLLGIALLETDFFRAQQVFSALASRVEDAETRVLALRRLVAAQIAAGNLAGAASTCDEAIEALEDRDPELLLDLEAQRYFMVMASRGYDDEASKRIQTIAAVLPGRTPGERVARQALALEKYFSCAPISQMLGLILPFPELPWQIRDIDSGITIAAPKMLAWSGRWDEARFQWGRWTELMHEQGRVIQVAMANSFLAEVDRLSGRLYESEAQARTSWEISRLTGEFSAYRWSALMNLGATLLMRGDISGFRALIGNLDLSAGPFQIPLNPWPLELRAYLHLEEGELESAVDDFLTLGESLENGGLLNPSYPPWRQEAAEALSALGRTPQATALVAVAEERARAFGAPHTIASVLRARSFVESQARAIRTLRESIGLFETSGPPHELARTQITLGAALRRSGSRKEAREILERALEIAHRCGAGGLEQRAREELAATGARPRRVVVTGVGALTATELKTAKLAATGLSNKEIAERLFVTQRTVETHLTHVYGKLGVAGRRALVKALT